MFWKNLRINGMTSSFYVVSPYGTIRNKEGKIIKPHITHDGYYRVRLCRDIPRGMYRVNRIVAETFIPNPNKYPMVNHLDNNRLNNHYTNLEWCDNSKNQKQRFETTVGTKAKRVAQYTLSGDLVNVFESPVYAEKELGICKGNICYVCRGLRKSAGGFFWKYI